MPFRPFVGRAEKLLFWQIFGHLPLVIILLPIGLLVVVCVNLRQSYGIRFLLCDVIIEAVRLPV